MQAREEQPGLVSQFVVVASAQVHRTGYQQGAYRESLFSGWLTDIGEPAYVPVVTAQEGYSDFWDPVEVTGHFGNVQWPAVHIGGWWDIFQQQNLDAFEAYRTQAGNVSVRDQQFFVMLPGGHCGGGAVEWPNKTWGNDYGFALANLVTDAAAAPHPPARATRNNMNNGNDDANKGKIRSRGRDNESIESPATALFSMPWAVEDAPKIVWYVLGPGDLGSVGNYWTAGDYFPTATPTKYYLSASDKLKPDVSCRSPVQCC